MSKTCFYNVQHSPIGAFASFTLGCKGAKGGLGLELGAPANESVYLGVETRSGGRFQALPFFAGAEDEAKRYEVEGGEASKATRTLVEPFADKAIRRELTPSRDTWTAGDLTFTVFSPVASVPDPTTGRVADLKLALVPAVLAELTIDNTAGKRPRTAFFGYAGNSPYTKMRRLREVTADKLAGVATGLRTALCCADGDVVEGSGFSLEDILRPRAGLVENRTFGLGGTGVLLVTVAPGEKRTVRFAIVLHAAGPATSGIDSVYWYTRYFPTLESAGAFALKSFDAIVRRTDDALAKLPTAHLSDDQRFTLAHTIHSYYGSTELLDVGGTPFWVVNEGEYRMMNTFDLTADQVYFEMLLNPWTVRNELEWYSLRFSYRDKVRLPGETAEYPGGLSFTHDMGIANVVSRPEYSSYEMFGLDGCFSHMTHEELVNWLLCALTYVFRTRDYVWLDRNEKTFVDAFRSMENRDHFDPQQRDGVMSLDSSRCMGGAEITTYDSLDTSLGQARNNLYLAVKCWAAYALLGDLFQARGQTGLARRMIRQAMLAAQTVVSQVDPTSGMLPAVLHEGVESRIIPAIEGLAFPLFAGRPALVDAKGPYGELVAVLRRHLEAVLKPGVCLFKDGGWKLSSTSDNSWLSKIYLCQFVARHVLGLKWDSAGKRADAAHVAWLLDPQNAYWAWSDQIVAGVAKGSKYYPRGVTSALWTLEALKG